MDEKKFESVFAVFEKRIERLEVEVATLKSEARAAQIKNSMVRR